MKHFCHYVCTCEARTGGEHVPSGEELVASSVLPAPSPDAHIGVDGGHHGGDVPGAGHGLVGGLLAAAADAHVAAGREQGEEPLARSRVRNHHLEKKIDITRFFSADRALSASLRIVYVKT